ncbi:MAG: thioesterase [Verrucomicrobia bacterium]|nr:thioesterase [Verrucomicrobiota bacterium]
MPNYTITYQPRNNPKGRIFCIPYAGATAAYYRAWIPYISSDIELVGVEIPGRAYLKDLPATSMSDLISTILPQIELLVDRPFVLYGHSYGSCIAYELAKHLHPKALFVSSRRAPHIPSPLPPASPLPDNEFLDVMQNLYNAIPASVLKDKELLNMLLPTFKEDIRINETYVASPLPLLETPIFALYGKDDKTVSSQDMQAWQEVTKGTFTYLPFEGGHFFIDQAKAKVIRMIEDSILMS